MSQRDSALRLLSSFIAVSAAPALLASSITFSSLPGTDTSFGTAEGYRSNWNNLQSLYPVAPAGYGSSTINLWDWPVQGNVSNQGLIPGGSATTIAFHYQVDFTVNPGNAGAFDFRIAPDFGFGGAAFLNGVAVAFTQDDLWWGLDWNNSAEQLQFSKPLAAGNYTLDVYGQEGCCDGPTGAQFRVDGGQWNAFGSNDGMTAVPEATALPFLGPAVLLLGIHQIRRRYRA